MLRLGEAGKAPSVGHTGKLPPDTQLPEFYKLWRSKYSQLGKRLRALRNVEDQSGGFSSVKDCDQASQSLASSFNQWLNSEDFLPLKKILEQVDSSEELRIVIQNNEVDLLRKLPWHLWDIIQSHNAEIAISSPNYQIPERIQRIRFKPRILAILGNSEGIKVDVDKKLLEQLGKEKNAEIVYLLEPNRKQIYEALWKDDKGWDILFFAGHGASHIHNGEGRIYINKNDSLSISDLKEDLKTAIKRGLRLAIFNSCEGLGLVKELESLHIPQVIVMKEPVPDEVAQEFLKYFLNYFANGESLYSAVRKAREKLQEIENLLPSATWLPVICQNPAEVPLTWQELTPPKVDYVSKIIEYLLLGIFSLGELLEAEVGDNQENISNSQQPDVIELTNVGDFWTRNLSKGQWVSITGALSQYAPMFIGPPMLKREVLRGYRRAIPKEDYENSYNQTAVDANIAFTAAQMVLRLNPEETQSDWVYMGFYHSIVRNSIPVFVAKKYYTNVVEPLFEKDGNRIAYVVEAKITGRLIPFPSNYIKEFIEKNNIKSYIKPELLSDVDKEILAIFVDGIHTKIEYLGTARYLDGDIWVALKSGVEEIFVSRFINLSDVEDVRQQSQALQSEAREFSPDGELVYQFDQVEKLIPGYQTVNSMIERFTKRRPPDA
ncbi:MULTISPECIES: CHAT domain-containing protein [Calothrix]|uniref:CHAT domain-containing protein n=2 Tax=Calothrix TaxID=1186 RepID=A0ABR8AC86_9CYAN|nr:MULTISPECIES: CHAT domain-containing protein [Calothrix]MBD2197630.1 CHAT domain-containing protein [Calothrix parietina FACHB-288]MBD2227414.1 CHAT domain-containing protein [Calothrix anomala FACHB-343]